MSSNLAEGDVIGFDIGEKRVGVARINSFAKIAEPLETITVSNESLLEKVKLEINKYNPIAVVIGLPRGLDGQETAQTVYSRSVAEDLNNMINLPVYLIDEAGSSKKAEELATAHPNVGKDSLAAAVFLEDFINFENIELLKVKP